MASQIGINKLVAGIAVAGALTLMSLLGGAASADGGGEAQVFEEVKVIKIMDSPTPSDAGYNTWRTNFGRTY